jgi:nitrate reductase gamma subunit
MLDIFLFAALPYVAVFVLFAGSYWRYRTDRFSYSALSSQFLEDRKLLWGSIPWHVGILVILLGHVLGLCFPGVWHAIVANRTILLLVEFTGLLFTILCVVGLTALAFRRATSGKLQIVSTPVDFAVLGLLLAQVLLGMWVALAHRWGAAWAPASLSPYLASLATFSPKIEYVADMPGLVKMHIAGAWFLLLLIPFSRLVHIFSIPLEYLWRRPQKVVWTNPRRFNQAEEQIAVAEDRRVFIRAGLGLTAGVALLGVGTADKMVRYFKGPEMTPEEEGDLLAKKLERLEQTSDQRELELERIRAQYIRVARLDELTANKGKYFTDYQMRPALAFLGPDGLPLLISAKCTHLGCTVGSDVDGDGRLLCPCHVSYFDLKTGVPNAGAPAKSPLGHLGWALMDDGGNVLVAQGPDGKREGTAEPDALNGAIVCIARRFEVAQS